MVTHHRMIVGMRLSILTEQEKQKTGSLRPHALDPLI